MKRLAWGAVWLLALCVLLSACGSNSGGGKQATGDTGSASTASPSAGASAPPTKLPEASATPGEPVEFSVFFRAPSWDPDNAYLPIMEKATNTKIDFTVTPLDEYDNKLHVIMASGKYPNVVTVDPTSATFHTYVDEGLLLPLDSYLDKYPAVKNAFTQEEWDNNRNPKDGKIYHIPFISGIYPQIFTYRKDWADELGIAPPKTTADVKAMLEAFKNQNPGKIQNLIPFTPNENAISDLQSFLSAYGSDYMAWQPSKDDPKHLVLSNTLPEFEQGLLFVRDLRKEGLLDKGWMVAKDRGLFKFYASTAGATVDEPQYVDLREEAIQDVQKQGKIAYVPSLTGPNGVEGGIVLTPNAQGYGTAITKSTTPEQADAIFRLINWQYTDGWDTMFYGVEGKSYDVVNGQKVKRGRDAVLKNDPKYDLYMLDRVLFAPPPKKFEFNKDTFGQLTPDQFQYAGDMVQAAISKAHKNYAMNMNDPVITENLGKIQSDVDEVASKIILNPNVDADKTFNDYLNKLKQDKIDEVTEAVNQLNPVK